MSRLALVLSATLVAGASGACSCGGGTANLYPCPGDPDETHLGAKDTKCKCQSPSDVYQVGSLRCNYCDSQDAEGKYCRCPGGALIDMSLLDDAAVCVSAEQDEDCGHNKYVDDDGECRSCHANQCGGECGSCHGGLACLDGKCQPIVECQLNLFVIGQCSDVIPDGCYIVGTSLYTGVSCYCDVAPPMWFSWMMKNAWLAQYAQCMGRYWGQVAPL